MSRQSLNNRRGLDWLCDAQDRVATRRQLREHGFDDDAVRARVAAGRWQVSGRSGVVLHNGPLNVRQRQWAAVLSQHRAALGGLTAACDLGLTGFEDDLIHVLGRHSARRHQLPGVRVHVSRHFEASDIHPGRALPTVRIERALVDGATWIAQPRKACAVIAAGVQQRLTTPARLAVAVAAPGTARHRTLLTRILGDIEGGAQPFGEIDFARLVRRAGLPPPTRQAFRFDRAGRRRWLDADLDGFSVEIDGSVHLRPLRYWDDVARQNDLVIATGRPVLRFSTVAFRIDEDIVVEQLVAAHRRFGR